MSEGNATQGLARATSPLRPLRGPPQAFTRQPDLGSPPQVSSVTGLGTGGGAYILNNGSDADRSQGLVACVVGRNAAASGTLALNFPVAPVAGQYFLSADWASLSAVVVTGNVLSMSWTATQPLVAGTRLLLAYQWNVSN